MGTKTPDMTLTYDPLREGGPWFMAVGANQYPKGKGKYDKIKVDKGDDAVMTFTIVTEGIDFNKDKPIEIRFQSGQAPGDTNQFTPKLLAPNVLEVKDANIETELTEYYYQLNFVGKPPLDPIIQNGCCLVRPSSGGGVMTMLSSPTGIALVLLAVIAIILAARKMWAR